MEHTICPIRQGQGIYTVLCRAPGIQLLFIGPQACSRHGLLSSLRDLRGRISFLCLTETEVVTGRYLDRAAEAAKTVVSLRKARALVLLTCCQNALLGTDYHALQQQLERETGVPVRCLEVNRLNMYARHPAPLMNRSGEELLYDFLEPRPRDQALSVNLIGPLQLDSGSELFPFLKKAGAELIRTVDSCPDFDAYQRMAGAHLNLVLAPSGQAAALSMEQRLGIPWLPLNAIYDPDELSRQYLALGRRLGCSAQSVIAGAAVRREQLAEKARARGGSCVVDGRWTWTGPSLTRFLLNCGLSVDRLLLNQFSSIDEQELEQLRLDFPNLIVERTQYTPAVDPTPSSLLRCPLPDDPYPIGFRAMEAVLTALLEEETP